MSDTQYSTAAKAMKIGRALAINTNDAGLDTPVKHPHMTLNFNRDGGFTQDDVDRADEWIAAYLEEQGLADSDGRVSFSLEPWGKRSDKVLGDLAQLCLAFRADAGFPQTGPHREPHIELRRRS